MREVAFQAIWTTENCRLQYHLSDIVYSPFHSTCQKIDLFFRRILQYINEGIGYPLHQYAKQYLVGGMRSTPEQYRTATDAWMQHWEGASPSPQDLLLRRGYEPCRLMMTTPDGVPIEGTLYRSRRTENTDIPTIICTNPNWAAISREEGWNWLLEKGLISCLPFNVIVFDYRACAGQAGVIHTPSDLTLDADTFYQVAQKKLGVSEANIHYIGFCTGAQVAATLAVLHPLSGRLVGHNSTYNIGELLHKSPFIQEEIKRHGYPTFCVMKELIRAYINWSGWAMDVTDVLNEIHERVLFTHHVDDRFVTEELHASNAIDRGKAKHTALLYTKENVHIDDPDYVTHWMPLFLCKDENGLCATQKILNFILDQEAFTPDGNRERYIIQGHRNGLRDIVLVS